MVYRLPSLQMQTGTSIRCLSLSKLQHKFLMYLEFVMFLTVRVPLLESYLSYMFSL
jgi:hypothetical protein